MPDNNSHFINLDKVPKRFRRNFNGLQIYIEYNNITLVSFFAYRDSKNLGPWRDYFY